MEYYGIFGLCRMREVDYTSTKLLSVHMRSFLSVHVRDAFRISTWSLSQARNSWHSAVLLLALALSNSIALQRATPFWIGVNCLYLS